MRAGHVQQMRLRSSDCRRAPGNRRSGQTELVASLAGVHKRYGKTVALAGLDLDVRRGELLAVLGPNGAGKSTAVSLWLGLLEPEAGNVHLFGGSPLDPDRRRRVGVMMQEVGLTPELRVRELIELTASYYPEPLPLESTLTLTRLGTLADRHLFEAVGRPEAPGAICRRDLRPPIASLPRRTDGGSRCRSPRIDVAHDSRVDRPGLFDRPDDALSGGGGSVGGPGGGRGERTADRVGQRR